MNKKSILYITILILVALGAYILLRPNTTKPTPSPTPQPDQVESVTSVIVDYGNGETVTVNVDLSETQTAISALEYFADTYNINLETTQYDFGVLVDSINGKENTEDFAWIYFVNGESASVGADQYKLNPGDTILWKYTEPVF